MFRNRGFLILKAFPFVKRDVSMLYKSSKEINGSTEYNWHKLISSPAYNDHLPDYMLLISGISLGPKHTSSI